jgi:hypothetical protein
MKCALILRSARTFNINFLIRFTGLVSFRILAARTSISIRAETGIKTIPAVHSQCRCWGQSQKNLAVRAMSGLPSLAA